MCRVSRQPNEAFRASWAIPDASRRMMRVTLLAGAQIFWANGAIMPRPPPVYEPGAHNFSLAQTTFTTPISTLLLLVLPLLATLARCCPWVASSPGHLDAATASPSLEG